MKKNVISIIVILLLLTTVVIYNVYNKKIALEEAKLNNQAYESFLQKEVLGTDVISVINKAIDSNKKNLIEEDNENNFIDNGENTIKIDIKFKELEQVITMERINKIGMQQFWKNYGALSFKCTKIEYHSKTNNIKYMYFEQV